LTNFIGDTRRQKEEETATRAAFLEQENAQLKTQISLLKSEIAKLHTLLVNGSAAEDANNVVDGAFGATAVSSIPSTGTQLSVEVNTVGTNAKVRQGWEKILTTLDTLLLRNAIATLVTTELELVVEGAVSTISSIQRKEVSLQQPDPTSKLPHLCNFTHSCVSSKHK